jgi:cell division protein FtsB
MSHENYFFEKWNIDDVTADSVLHHFEILQNKISDLEARIVTLEEENVELTNELYRLENSLDCRIDIIANTLRKNEL